MKIKCKYCGLKWDSRWGTKFYIVDPVSGEGCCIECHNQGKDYEHERPNKWTKSYITK